MASILVSGGGGSPQPVTLTFPSGDGSAAAQAIANVIDSTASGQFTGFGVTGTTFLAATTVAGNSSGVGSTYSVVTGSGDDLIFANDSGSVDADAGTNLVLLGTGVSTVTTYGVGDIVAQSSGAATIATGRSGAIVFDGSGGTYYTGTSTNLFVSGISATRSDAIRGTKDLMSLDAESLTYVAAADGSAKIAMHGGQGARTRHARFVAADAVPFEAKPNTYLGMISDFGRRSFQTMHSPSLI